MSSFKESEERLKERLDVWHGMMVVLYTTEGASAPPSRKMEEAIPR